MDSVMSMLGLGPRPIDHAVEDGFDEDFTAPPDDDRDVEAADKRVRDLGDPHESIGSIIEELEDLERELDDEDSSSEVDDDDSNSEDELVAVHHEFGPETEPDEAFFLELPPWKRRSLCWVLFVAMCLPMVYFYRTSPSYFDGRTLTLNPEDISMDQLVQEWVEANAPSSSTTFMPPERWMPSYLYSTWDKRPVRARTDSEMIENDREKLRKFLHEFQNPESCTSRPLCRCENVSGGLFSKIHSRVFCLAMAVQRNCTLVDHPENDNPTHYVNEDMCDYRRFPSHSAWDCYFKPISRCSRLDVFLLNEPTFTGKGQQSCPKIRKAFRKVRDNLNLQYIPDELIQAEFTAWVMRPNSRLQANIRKYAKQLGLDTDKALQDTVGVHVRHGDKHGIGMKERNHTKYVDIAKETCDTFHVKTVHFMSDDLSMKSQLSTLKKYGIKVITIPPEEFPSYQIFIANPTESVDLMLQRYKKEGTKVSGDEGLMLLTQALIVSKSRAINGNFGSNVGKNLYELNHFVNSDVYFKPDHKKYTPCAFGSYSEYKVRTENP